MKVNMFLPKYMVDFKCIASDCKDTCCAGWDINIDEDSYNRYDQSSGTLKKIVEGKFTINKEEHDYFNHGFMILKGESRCPFLNDDMLCDIHGGAGEEHLCITCKNYPRVFNIVDDVYEKSGLPSCEEICRKAFLNNSKMEFVEIEEEIDEESIEIRRIIDTEAFEGTESLLQYFWDMRIASINILQNREYSIEERLNILEGFYKEIESLKEDEDFEGIEEVIDSLGNDDFDYESLKGKSKKEDFNLYKSLGEDTLYNNIRSVRLKKCAEEYRKGISGIESSNQLNDVSEEYCIQIEQYEYILENYLVNEIFKGLLPFNKGEDLMQSFVEFYNKYRIVKAYTIGIALSSKSNIDEESIIRVIQAFSKDAEHNKVFNEIMKINFI